MGDEQFTYEVPQEITTDQRQLDPYPFFEEMRENAPVRYDEERSCYDVFLYDDVISVLEDEDRFTKVDAAFFSNSLGGMTQPEYGQARSVLEKPFTPGAVRDRRGELEALADDVVDVALSSGDEVSFVSDVAKPYPIIVIARLLGVPADRLDTFRKWSLSLAEAPAELSPEAMKRNRRRRVETIEEMHEFFSKLLAERERNPTDDLMTKMLQAEDEFDTITRAHTIANCNLLLLAGNVTTTTLLTNAIWTFDNEDVTRDLVAGDVPLKPAIEEVLRYQSPVMRVKRNATADTRLGGTDVEAGASVIGWISSAHRDPGAFDRPDEFDPFRQPKSHPVPFGKGIRFCLGAHLARLEAEVVLETLFDRVSGFSIVDKPEPFISAEIFGPKELHLQVSR